MPLSTLQALPRGKEVLRKRSGVLLGSDNALFHQTGLFQVAAFRIGDHPVRGSLVSPLLSFVPRRRRTACRTGPGSGAHHGLAVDSTLRTGIESTPALPFEA